MNYKDFFNNKKIAVIGLGPHGEMLQDIKFLVKNKAFVSVYDIRSEKRLKDISTQIKNSGLASFTFGKVDGHELLNFDLILISSEVSKKSLFLKKAFQAEIQIEYPETLFFKLSPQITLVGIMGQYGKTIVGTMLYEILRQTFALNKNQNIFLIDPDSHQGTLVHLKKIKKDDVIVARIPEHLMQAYYDIRICPQVAVLTSLVDFDILDFQTYNNFIIAPDEVIDAIREEKGVPLKAKMLRTRANFIPPDWNIKTHIVHTKENIALVIQASELFKVSPDVLREVVLDSLVSKGSIEFVKKVDGVEYYNDSHSITPRSTLSALRSVSVNHDTVLILGGAYTGLDYSDLLRNISEYVRTVILIPGSGTLGIRSELEGIQDITIIHMNSLEDAVKEAHRVSIKGGKVLFSPAFDAVGVDLSRKERGEKFVKTVRGLK